MSVELKGVSKAFGGTAAIADLTFDVPNGKLLTILGPSGSGKTTLLRCIAGVDRPDSGKIIIGGKVVFDSERRIEVPPEERGVGMVFQSNALWPHMTVQKNVAYPLEVRGEKDWSSKVSKVLSLLSIGELADRLPSEISGGEQQRVAIARSIVYNPALVLLDEPFSSLDAPLRESLRDELRKLQLNLGTTMLYVTHERVDAMSLGDQMAILSDGRLMAMGAPDSLLSSPPNSYTARFLGGMLAIPAEAALEGDGWTRASSQAGSFKVRSGTVGPGKAVLCIPPWGCRVVNEGGPGTIPGTVTGVVRRSMGMAGIRVATDSGPIEVPVHGEYESPRPGAKVFLKPDTEKCLLLPS